MTATSELSGKVVAITGVSGGIGRAAAQSLARRGALVVGVDLRAERAEQVAADLRAEGFAMTARAGDVSDPTECARFVDGWSPNAVASTSSSTTSADQARRPTCRPTP